jgi:hypothetical protein
VAPLPGVRPGLDHPPPGNGEGDRESVMGDGSGFAGVPGIGVRVAGRTELGPAGRPEVLPSPQDESRCCCVCGSLTRRRGGTEVDERRRWWELVTIEGVGGSRLDV